MIRLAGADAFQRVRSFLRERYSDEIAGAALGVASVQDFDLRENKVPIRDPLVRVLFAGAAIPAHELSRVAPAGVLEDMAGMGLLRVDDGRIWSPVVVYPFFDLHLVSDRFVTPDGSQADRDSEFVYFALTRNTLTYVETLPDSAAGSFLDIGGGCGAAALLQASFASSCCSSDISARATLYAEFNRRLNDVPNVEVVQGSLYEPVEGQQFDRIGCHPPYDMTAVTPWTFADGGDDGEFVIRGAIAGLETHLARGGEFIALFRAADCSGRPLEQRVREWIGARHEEFDIALVVRDTIAPQEHAFACAMSTGGAFDGYRICMERYNEMEVEQLVYCSLLIRRRHHAGSPLTLRRAMGKQAGYEELRWLLDWERTAPTVDISSATFRVSPEMEVMVKHRSRNGRLQPVQYSVVTTAPFRDETECAQWVALLISEFDGRRTSAEIFEGMRRNGPLQRDHFDTAVKRLISLGVLQPASGSSTRSFG